MAIGHIAIRAHSRKRGHSAAAALAYRCGLALTCSRTGEVFNYSRRNARQEIVGSGFANVHRSRRPPPAVLHAVAQQFADAIESAEDTGANSEWHRRNACILRDVQMALPHVLDDEQRLALTETFAHKLASRYEAHTAWSVHRPDREGDARNHHAHIVLPSRNRRGEKIAVLNDRATGPVEVKAIRALWQETANAALVAAEHQPVVDTGRRLDAHPQPTLGSARTARERGERRKRPLPYEGKSVAQMCLDGHSVTGAGRRLECHVRAKEKAEYDRFTAQLMAAEEVAALPAVEAREVAPHPEPDAPTPPTQRTRRPRRRRVRETMPAPIIETANSTAELQPSPHAKLQRLDRAIRACEQQRAALALAPAPSIAPEAFDLINAIEAAEAKEATMPPPTTEKIEIAPETTDWRSMRRAPRTPERIPAEHTIEAAKKPRERPAQAPEAATPTTAPMPPTTAHETPQAPRAAPEEYVDCSTVEHVPPEPAPTQRPPETDIERARRRRPTAVQAWAELGGLPPEPREFENVSNWLAGTDTRRGLDLTIDAIACARLDGSAPTGADQHIRYFAIRDQLKPTDERDEHNRGPLRSHNSAEAAARILAIGLDAYQREQYGGGRDTPNGPPKASIFDAWTKTGREKQRAGFIASTIKRWRTEKAPRLLRQIREAIISPEVLALRHRAERREAAERTARERRARFGILRRGTRPGKDDSGHDR